MLDEGSAVQPPDPSSAVGCVACLLEGVYAPLDISYTFDGCSFCAKHVKFLFAQEVPITLAGVVRRP